MSIQHKRLQAQVDAKNARIAQLEAALTEEKAALAHQTTCREDSDRKLMAADDALNATAYQLAEARAMGDRYQKADDAAVQLLEKAKMTLEVPAAESIPAISDAWQLIENALEKIR